jgi:hypothetical protein
VASRYPLHPYIEALECAEFDGEAEDVHRWYIAKSPTRRSPLQNANIVAALLHAKPHERPAESHWTSRVAQGLAFELAAHSVSAADLPDPNAMVAAVVGSLPVPGVESPWRDVLGPVFTRPSLQKLLDCESDDLDAQISARRLLGIVTSDGWQVFPAWQFADGMPGPLLPGLSDVLAALLPTSANDETLDLLATGWLRGEHAVLDGLTPLDWLRKQNHPNPLLTAAHEAARRWTQ